jgi:hypothetical protein
MIFSLQNGLPLYNDGNEGATAGVGLPGVGKRLTSWSRQSLM